MNAKFLTVALTWALFIMALPPEAEAALVPACSGSVSGQTSASLDNVDPDGSYSQPISGNGTCALSVDATTEGTNSKGSSDSVIASGAVMADFAVVNGTVNFTGSLSTSGATTEFASINDAGADIAGDAQDQASAVFDLSFEPTDAFVYNLVCSTYQYATCEILLYSSYTGFTLDLGTWGPQSTGSSTGNVGGSSSDFPSAGGWPYTDIKIFLYGSAQSGNTAYSRGADGYAASSNEATASYVLQITPAPPNTLVPIVVGLTQAAAATSIAAANLTLGAVTMQASTSVPSGQVMSQSPTGGTEQSDGTTVSLVVSSGPPTTTVPGVVGLTQGAAAAAIAAANLTLGAVTAQASISAPDGQVISQSPAAGASAGDGTAVNIVVSSGPATTTVPNVVKLDRADAVAAIESAGLTLGLVTTQSSASVGMGQVISQSPLAGLTEVYGTDVNLNISSGPPVTTVPNVIGLPQAAAVTAIIGADLTLGTVTLHASDSVAMGDVISQQPVAGAADSVGAAVNLVVSTGRPTTRVPDVVGTSQDAAETSITDARLRVGNVTHRASRSVPAGDVTSQTPAAGIREKDGTAVDLVVSSGRPTVIVALAGNPVVTSTPRGWLVKVMLQNKGNVAIQGLLETAATFNGLSQAGSVAPIRLLRPDAAGIFKITFPRAAGISGESVGFSMNGRYRGRGLRGDWSIKLPAVTLPAT